MSVSATQQSSPKKNEPATKKSKSKKQADHSVQPHKGRLSERLGFMQMVCREIKV